MIKIAVRTKCIESRFVESYYEYDICREVDKKVDEFDEPFGHGIVYYTVYFEDDMIESFKTLAEAKKFIERLL